ncbi:EI24 domain-containing protein [Roseibium sp. Sym1]|uniref:EI24 domain-containing protein n=1 Tax=Roseibium sp. Sym1 TaxID=3016006 RepID=UPI0022B2E279|nr:EI24 domain-containing protein [Roseibium sp. Sym1]
MTKLVVTSFLQTFSVAGLDAILRALGWVIAGLLGILVLSSLTSAYFLSTFLEEFILLAIAFALQALPALVLLVFSSYILAPTSVVYGLAFQSTVAKAVETRNYRDDLPGQQVIGAKPFLRAVRTLILLVLISLFSVVATNLGGFFSGLLFYWLATGRLLGRDQFLSTARRYLSDGRAEDLCRQNAWPVFFAGLAMSGFMLVPVLNLATPVFSTILTIHLFKRLHRRPQSDQVPLR